MLEVQSLLWSCVVCCWVPNVRLPALRRGATAAAAAAACIYGSHLFDRCASGANENPWVKLERHVNPNAACSKDGALQFPGIAAVQCELHLPAHRDYIPPSSDISTTPPPNLATQHMSLTVQADETALELFRRANRKPLRTGLAFFDEVRANSMWTQVQIQTLPVDTIVL